MNYVEFEALFTAKEKRVLDSFERKPIGHPAVVLV